MDLGHKSFTAGVATRQISFIAGVATGQISFTPDVILVESHVQLV